MSLFRIFPLLCAVLTLFSARAVELSVATFMVDATPPVGSPLCIGTRMPVVDVTDPLSARGVVLLPEGQKPIVLCAVDWVGVANAGNTAWREALAEAAGTTPDRVTVHALHQHDAPYCGFTTEDILQEHGLGGAAFDPAFASDVIRRSANAAALAAKNASPVTHVATGEAVVDHIASNRRLMSEDGKTVEAVRFTAARTAELRAAPVGTIDPFLKSVSFWNGEQALAVLTYYATHPQSHYGKGHVTPDFVGLARKAREDATGAPHIHFNGAGGNLGAGKWNDGSPENRPVLTARLAEGMKAAWEAREPFPVAELELDWAVEPVLLPLRAEVDDADIAARLADTGEELRPRIRMAREIAFRERVRKGTAIEVSRLRIGDIQMIHLPGELFVEYQIAAQNVDPGTFTCVAAYGDYGPGYIGTDGAYSEGGYETQLYISRTGPGVEGILMGAIETLAKP